MCVFQIQGMVGLTMFGIACANENLRKTALREMCNACARYDNWLGVLPPQRGSGDLLSKRAATATAFGH